MKARRAARALALDVLYEAEIRAVLPRDALSTRSREGWVIPSMEERRDADVTPERDPTDEVLAYARVLVEGVQDHQADIDELITRHADRWALERMPVVDRNIVRMAIYELLWREDVPVPVAINEAVDLAKHLSTDDSGRFVNGLLGRIVEVHHSGRA